MDTDEALGHFESPILILPLLKNMRPRESFLPSLANTGEAIGSLIDLTDSNIPPGLTKRHTESRGNI
jgi:hypothetical protein